MMKIGAFLGPQRFFLDGMFSLSQPQNLNFSPSQTWNNFIIYPSAWILAKLHLSKAVSCFRFATFGPKKFPDIWNFILLSCRFLFYPLSHRKYWILAQPKINFILLTRKSAVGQSIELHVFSPTLPQGFHKNLHSSPKESLSVFKLNYTSYLNVCMLHLDRTWDRSDWFTFTGLNV